MGSSDSSSQAIARSVAASPTTKMTPVGIDRRASR
jgi:hypothetical protein